MLYGRLTCRRQASSWATQHQVARPVGCFRQLKDFRLITERVKQLYREGLHFAQIAAKLNAEGFVPPRRRGAFTKDGLGALARDLGLVGEMSRHDLLKENESWIPAEVCRKALPLVRY